MVGNIVHREVAEPIFRETLKQLDDGQLESAGRNWIWQRETTLHGPYKEDEWHCDCIKEECHRRERPPSSHLMCLSAGCRSSTSAAIMTTEKLVSPISTAIAQ
jgi:hypothetical protein